MSEVEVSQPVQEVTENVNEMVINDDTTELNAVNEGTHAQAASIVEEQQEEPQPVSKYKRRIVKPTAPAPVKTPSPSQTPPKEKKTPYVPSDSLMRTTEARKLDSKVLSEKKQKADDPFAVKKVGKNLPPPSEHLTSLTQNRLSAMHEWDDHKGKINEKDDIWWEQRKMTEKAKPMKVQSKLLDPTSASLSQKRDKHSQASPEKERHKAIPAPIDKENRLLKPTKESLVQSWAGDPSAVPPPAPTLHLATEHSGPQNVHSKLKEETKAAQAAKWKGKQESEPFTPPPALHLETGHSGPKNVHSKLKCETAAAIAGKWKGREKTKEEIAEEEWKAAEAERKKEKMKKKKVVDQQMGTPVQDKMGQEESVNEGTPSVEAAPVPVESDSL